jgi:monothiol glutaredoxin
MESVLKKIDSQVANNKVILFMKGTREMPQCGFSAKVVQIHSCRLTTKPSTFADRNQAGDQGIPSGLTPLFIGGKFIGGCDICVQMNESGELEPILKDAVRE